MSEVQICQFVCLSFVQGRSKQASIHGEPTDDLGFSPIFWKMVVQLQPWCKQTWGSSMWQLETGSVHTQGSRGDQAIVHCRSPVPAGHQHFTGFHWILLLRRIHQLLASTRLVLRVVLMAGAAPQRGRNMGGPGGSCSTKLLSLFLPHTVSEKTWRFYVSPK